MRALIMGPDEKARIAEAIEKARQKPVPLDVVMSNAAEYKEMITLADRNQGLARESQKVPLPIGYCACFSFEQQPDGLTRHLSVSVDAPGHLPSQEAFMMIADEFGFTLPLSGEDSLLWLEEFALGHCAVNLIQLKPGDSQ